MKGIKLKTLTFGIISSMILGSISPIFASDSVHSVENQSTSQEGTFETKVYAQIGSEYLVTIPKSLTLSGVDKTGRYEVKVDGDMASEELIKVIPDNFLTLNSPNKESQIGLINQDKIEWTYKDLDVNGNGTIVAEDITAGGWSGTFNFNINIEIPQILISNATNKNNETVIVQTNSITGVEKNDLLSALEQSGQIESTEDIKSVINVSTTTDVDKIEIDVSGVAKPGDTIVVVQEKTDEWDYVSTETVDNNNKVTVDVTNSNPVSFIETKPDGSIHVHVYEEKVAQDATCTTDGVLLMACKCDRSYSFTIPASHDIELVEKKDENGNLINKYYECKNCDYSILNLTKLFAGNELSHDCNNYLTTKYDSTNHWNECSVCGTKSNIIKHTYKTTWAAGSESCEKNNSYTKSCACGYSYTGHKPCVWDGKTYVFSQKEHTHSARCSVCNGNINYEYYIGEYGVGTLYKKDTKENTTMLFGKGNLSGWCYDSSNQKIGCEGGTCALCGGVNIKDAHYISMNINTGKIYCSLCGTNFGTISRSISYNTSTPTTITYILNISLTNGATLYSSGGLRIVGSPFETTTREITSINTTKTEATIKYTGTFKSTWKMPYSCYAYIYLLTNGQTCFTYATSEYFYPDKTKPTISSITQTNLSESNGWATSKQITIKGTESYSNNVTAKITDENNNVIYNGKVAVTDKTYTINCTPNVEANDIGKTFKVTITDDCKNAVSQTFTVSKMDRKAPTILSSSETDTVWSQNKEMTFTAVDEGIGNVKIAFNNINEYVDMTKNGTTYSKEYQFSGDVYGEIIAAIYYTDAAGNVATQFVKIHNLDNTAPTITNYSLDNKTITIEANDLNSELNLEGSGITGYALTWSPAQPQETDWQSSNQIQISGSGIYYLWAKDLVGNVSKPYKIKVIL